jgi:hypothetical protein
LLKAAGQDGCGHVTEPLFSYKKPASFIGLSNPNLLRAAHPRLAVVCAGPPASALPVPLPAMDALCIICLTALPSLAADPPAAPDVLLSDGPTAESDTLGQSRQDVAHLQNCRHMFHDHCLAVWIEVCPLLLLGRLIGQVANTCPACRSNFNQVDISDTIEGNFPRPHLKKIC